MVKLDELIMLARNGSVNKETKRDKVIEYLKKNPNATRIEIRDNCECSRAWASKVKEDYERRKNIFG